MIKCRLIIDDFISNGIKARKFAVLKCGRELEVYDDDFHIVKFDMSDGYMTHRSLGLKTQLTSTNLIKSIYKDVICDKFSTRILEEHEYAGFPDKILLSNIENRESVFIPAIVSDISNQTRDTKICPTTDIDIIFNSNTIEGIAISKQGTENILSGKIAPSTRDELEVRNIKNAIDFLDSADINSSNILEAHHHLLKDIRDTEAGLYRTYDVVVDNFTPIESVYVRSQMNAYFNWYNDLQVVQINPIVKAALLHAKFVQIHPFADGNGRIARMIMNKSLTDDGCGKINIRADKKTQYHKVLNDGHMLNDYSKFIDFIASEARQEQENTSD
ncbi:MAG: Fic family protein [Candidatus Ancillula sp.]|nr:Fic family protein [Candidatus Ancillula sp.]